ncbi:uncharacterized protein LOC115922561 [Strongylocentrotus purpuratus]|uniref:Uncharacterized protein n=1 Tax=Strongylocentrotus purpuratus TaxID=7668 RepID=A0A7M7SWZ6_STRPU|nr:uncharacterized protein LOC115922561 [Strongylocentrotus purpuratus]
MYSVQDTPKDTLFYFADPAAWIIGDSIVYWAARRVQQEGSGDLGCGAPVAWHGRRDLDLGQSKEYLSSLFTGEGSIQSHIIQHVGTNDLESESKSAFSSELKRFFEYVSGQGSIIIWSDILPRFRYREFSDEQQGLVDCKRRSLNRATSNVITSNTVRHMNQSSELLSRPNEMPVSLRDKHGPGGFPRCGG